MRRQSAFTLLEILVTIVVISIAATALIGIFSSTVRGSADPAIQQQATTIAEAYMEEIMLRAFEDPQGGELGNIEGDEGGRTGYDDIQDYKALGVGVATDQFGTTMPGYTVAVTITNKGLNGILAADSLLINVRVSHAAIDDILLSGYRTRYQ